MSLLTELRRRKVFQVAAVYAVTAWLLIQISTSIEEPLNLPSWLDTLVIVLLAIGFPIALILSWAFDLTPGGIRATPPEAAAAQGATPASRPSGPHWLFSALQALVLVAVGFLIFEQYFRVESAAGSATAATAAASGRTERFSILTPRDYVIQTGGSPTRSLAISPDGDTLAYRTSTRLLSSDDQVDGFELQPEIAIRRLRSRSTLRLPSDEGAHQPFFSPDGRWIGFFSSTGKLQKQLLDGGSAPVTILEGLNGAAWAFAVWLDDDRIVYSTSDGDPRLFIVSAEGGTPTPITEPDPINPETGVFPSDWIPGTEIVLFISASQAGDSQNIALEALDIASGRRQLVVDNAGSARYVPSGHLVFQRDGALLVSAFDPVALTLTGPALPLLDAVSLDGGAIVPQFDVASDGTLAYVPELDVTGRLVLVEPDGTSTELPEPAADYRTLSVSGDGARAAIGVHAGSGLNEVRVYDFARGDMRVLTASGADSAAEWRPDGRALALTTSRSEVRGLVERGLDGRERMLVPVVPSGPNARNVSWHPDGDLVAYTRQTGSEHDIWIARINDDEVVTEPLLSGIGEEMSPRFSADGRWLAYVVAEPAAANVYVMGWPDGEPVAVWGGLAAEPRWSKSGSELYFVGLTGGLLVMHSVSVGGEADSPEIGDAVPLFPMVDRNDDGTESGFRGGGNTGPGYDVLPDGRFLMVQDEGYAPAQEIAIARNWLAEIEGLAQ